MLYIEYVYTLITWIGEGLLYFIGFILAMTAQEIIGYFFAGGVTLMGYWSLRLFGIDRSLNGLDPICILIGFIEFLAILWAVAHILGLGEVS